MNPLRENSPRIRMHPLADRASTRTSHRAGHAGRFSRVHRSGNAADMYDKASSSSIREASRRVARQTGGRLHAQRTMASRSRCASTPIDRTTPPRCFHPLCHLEIHEQKGYQLLHGLHGVLVGSPQRLMALDDLKHVKEPLRPCSSNCHSARSADSSHVG